MSVPGPSPTSYTQNPNLHHHFESQSRVDVHEHTKSIQEPYC